MYGWIWQCADVFWISPFRAWIYFSKAYYWTFKNCNTFYFIFLVNFVPGNFKVFVFIVSAPPPATFSIFLLLMFRQLIFTYIKTFFLPFSFFLFLQLSKFVIVRVSLDSYYLTHLEAHDRNCMEFGAKKHGSDIYLWALRTSGSLLSRRHNTNKLSSPYKN